MKGEPLTHSSYRLKGALLESCSCRAPCPCWIGADPDGQACWGFNAYHIEDGSIGDVDVSGCDFLRVFDIPGNVRVPGSWREVFVIDAGASERQADAILAAYRGDLGGPLADLAKLVAQTLGVERASISYDLAEGAGSLAAGEVVSVAVEPYLGADGRGTTLCNSLMASVPRAPAYLARAECHVVSLESYGLQWTFEGRSAIHSEYMVVHDGQRA